MARGERRKLYKCMIIANLEAAIAGDGACTCTNVNAPND
jgi:hypothetical protein